MKTSVSSMADMRGGVSTGVLISPQPDLLADVFFYGENISFDASLVIYINSTNIPPIVIINKIYEHQVGPGVAQWLRRCATSRKVPGSIPGDVTGFFSDVFPSDRTMTLGSTQPLVKMSTRNIPGGKGGQCVRLTTYHHTVPLSRNLGALTSLYSSGPPMACDRSALPLPLPYTNIKIFCRCSLFP